jgi:phosphatidylglycerol:prolipoprotein diacylglycerol transferase
MHPDLFTVPIINWQIKSYGFLMMIGFLSAVWLAMRRAERVRASSDAVLDMSFLALIFGVVGARVFYVVHYWDEQFAAVSRPWAAAADITSGGLEFLGGLLSAAAAIAAYAYWKKLSIRLYMDILAPCVMWGLAFGRLGCFLNGCCYGGVCTAQDGASPAYSWAVQFPYGSPAHRRQWEERQVTVPAELVFSDRVDPTLLPAELLAMSVEKRTLPQRASQDAKEAYEAGKAGGDSKEIARLEAAVKRAEKEFEAHRQKLHALTAAQRFPSRINPERPTSVSELQALAGSCRSLPVHPTQIYASINGLLLFGLLSCIFYARKRHGIVTGVLFVLYPIPRFLLEFIRVDIPREHFGMTISQVLGLGMVALGVIYLLVLYTRMPLRSPVLANDPAFRPDRTAG